MADFSKPNWAKNEAKSDSWLASMVTGRFLPAAFNSTTMVLAGATPALEAEDGLLTVGAINCSDPTDPTPAEPAACPGFHCPNNESYTQPVGLYSVGGVGTVALPGLGVMGFCC